MCYYNLCFVGVPEKIIQIECKSNINHHLNDEDEYKLYVHGNFTKLDSKWTYTNLEHTLKLDDSMYTVIKWVDDTGREYFDAEDYIVNSTVIENAVIL